MRAHQFAAAMGGAAACALVSTMAWSQNALNLPGSLDRGLLISWLQANTDLDPRNVISVSPANIIGLMAVKQIEPAQGRQFSVQIRSEVISVETIREAGNSSWAADVNVDCRTRRGKVNRILDFPMRNLKGQGREAGGSAEWVNPPPGTHLYTVVAAVCDQGFQRPLATSLPVAAPSAPQPRPSSPSVIATAPRTPPPVAQSAPSTAPQTSPPAARPAPSPPAAESRPAQSAPRSRAAVQIAAVSSEAQAAQALRSAISRFGAGQDLSASTVRTVSNGQTLYRALVHGFSASAQAQAFCTAYKAAGRECFVRSALPADARSVATR